MKKYLLIAAILAGTTVFPSDANACGLLRGLFRPFACRQYYASPCYPSYRCATESPAPCSSPTPCGSVEVPSCDAMNERCAEMNAFETQAERPTTEVYPECCEPLPTDFEADVMGEVNILRERCGLAPLAYNAIRTAAARRTARYNASNGVCSHPYPVDCGEVCAAGCDAKGTALQWFNSPGHRAIILNPNATCFSAGCVKGTLGGGSALHWTLRVW